MGADLLSILKQSSNSLQAQQGLIGVASNNIENSNTPGYSRETGVLVESNPSFFINNSTIGGGAQLTTITQSRDQFLEAQIPATFAAASFSNAQSSILGSVDVLDPQATSSVGTQLSSFYAALNGMSQNPADPATRQGVVAAAQQVSASFNTTYTTLESSRSGIDTQLGTEVSQVNSLASQMADLNRQIQIASATGNPNTLLDQRQAVQDQLVQLTGVSATKDKQGNVDLAFADGTALVTTDSASTLSVLANAANDGHVDVQLTRADGSGPIPVTAGMGGTMGGQINARDTTLKNSETSLDTLAYDFANSVNAVQSTGYAEDGVTTGNNMFDLAGLPTSVGAASKISVAANVAADPTLIAASTTAGVHTGDGSNVLNMLNTQTQALSTGESATDSYATLVANFGIDSQNATALAAHNDALSTQLQTQRSSVSGVSTDEEMINLQAAQQGYDAIAKVITTSTSMIDTLMSIMPAVT